jgi:AcrR family transcriptional regulator
MWRIADAAGVSRQTLYNEFGERAGITRALLARETGRLLDGVERRWRQVRGRGAEDGDCLTAAMSWVLACASRRSHPLLRDVVTGHGHGAAGTGDGRGLAGVLTDLCRRLSDAAGSGGQPGCPDRLRGVEGVVRMTLSYLLVPAEAHRQARTQIAHAARNLLPDSPPPGRARTAGPTGGRAGNPRPLA